LRRAEEKSFSTLLSDVAETSDNLTYHLKHLARDGYVESPSRGTYKLAEKGLVFINTNQEKYEGLFPTLSCMIVIRTKTGRLMMRKSKLPHIGKLHDITFAFHSEQSLDHEIMEFLQSYRLEVSALTYRSTFRKRVVRDGITEFDKTFIVHEARLESYQHQADDREFVEVSDSDIASSPEVLSSSLDIDSAILQVGFTEKVYTISG
jgi:hypothetical protein